MPLIPCIETCTHCLPIAPPQSITHHTSNPSQCQVFGLKDLAPRIPYISMAEIYSIICDFRSLHILKTLVQIPPECQTYRPRNLLPRGLHTWKRRYSTHGSPHAFDMTHTFPRSNSREGSRRIHRSTVPITS
jgi:hypothetical protein